MSKFMLIPSFVQEKQAVAEIMNCNTASSRFGLVLTQQDAVALVKKRNEALSANGRIEFGGGIIDKLLFAFCDSRYIGQEHYVEIISELLDIFYYYKNDTMDEIGDDDLIKLMRDYFEEYCYGDLDLLRGRELDELARNVRFGNDKAVRDEKEEFKNRLWEGMDDYESY